MKWFFIVPFVIAVGLVSGAGANMAHNPDGVLSQKILTYFDDSVPGLRDSYAQLQSDQFLAHPPLIGPMNNVKDRLDWQGRFKAELALLNAKRKVSGKQEIKYKLSFLDLPEGSTGPVRKDWSVRETIDWIDAHS